MYLHHVWSPRSGSGWIQSKDCRLFTIPKKNAISIYNLLFRPLLLTKGLWDLLRVYHGTEFALIITAQQHLSPHWYICSHQPVLQSLSWQNHRAERIWPGINQWVNYPLKYIIIHMENEEELDRNDKLLCPGLQSWHSFKHGTPIVFLDQKVGYQTHLLHTTTGSFTFHTL